VSEDLTWRIVLLSVVFMADLTVLIKLIREELRDWYANGSVGRIQLFLAGNG